MLPSVSNVKLLTDAAVRRARSDRVVSRVRATLLPDEGDRPIIGRCQRQFA